MFYWDDTLQQSRWKTEIAPSEDVMLLGYVSRLEAHCNNENILQESI